MLCISSTKQSLGLPRPPPPPAPAPNHPSPITNHQSPTFQQLPYGCICLCPDYCACALTTVPWTTHVM